MAGDQVGITKLTGCNLEKRSPSFGRASWGRYGARWRAPQDAELRLEGALIKDISRTAPALGRSTAAGRR